MALPFPFHYPLLQEIKLTQQFPSLGALPEDQTPSVQDLHGLFSQKEAGVIENVIEDLMARGKANVTPVEFWPRHFEPWRIKDDVYWKAWSKWLPIFARRLASLPNGQNYIIVKKQGGRELNGFDTLEITKSRFFSGYWFGLDEQSIMRVLSIVALLTLVTGTVLFL